MSARIGVLAVQGDFAAHQRPLERLGASVVTIRTPDDLAGLDGLVLPGGESTAMSLLLRSNGLWDALGDLIRGGIPVLATCAGVILLANDIRDGRPDQTSLKVIDVTVRRNGYGRQSASFESEIEMTGQDRPFPAVFIRAPVIEDVGPGVRIAATWNGPEGRTPTMCVRDGVVVVTFHPELTTDLRVHELAFGSILRTASR
jgi:5'-phosphate synthase pdxT subunit